MTLLTSLLSIEVTLLINILITGVMSIIFSVTYCLVKQKEGFFKDIPLTLAFLPIAISGITAVLLFASNQTSINNSNVFDYGRVVVATLAAIVMIRFRSQLRSTEDLTYIFFLTAVALINGLGYLGLGAILYGVTLCIFILFHVFKFPIISSRNLNLKITIPEDLNYENTFEDIFNEYTTYHRLSKIKSSDMGTMFVLNFDIVMKKNKSSKELIDLIRTRNGNLNVVVTVKKFNND